MSKFWAVIFLYIEIPAAYSLSMKIFLLVLSLNGLNGFAANKIKSYQTKIKNDCPTVKLSNLLLKKSLIEFIHGNECNGRFSSLILKKCKNIDCRKLTDIYRQVQQARPGSVVGDD